MFKTRYRVARDSWYPRYWAVQYRLWFWPFWVEFGAGLLQSKEEAYDLIDTLAVEREGR
jgi:hypothetical protein